MAASCCLQLLQEQGHSIDDGAQTKSNPLPAVLLSQSTQRLLSDVFQAPDLFARSPRIRQRVVAWASRQPVSLAHDAVAVSESTLLGVLNARLGFTPKARAGSDSEWTILTSRSGGAFGSGTARHFGVRTARVHPVELTSAAEPETCWVESTPEGWLFLMTTGPRSGSLLSVGGQAESLFAKSRLIAGKTQRLLPLSAEFSAYPRILENLCDPGWLACGSAAIAFDPLCGEGAGNAAREAILACAAVRAILAGEAASDVLAEYAMRLRLGFLRHLENCREFYLQDSESEFWRDELQKIEQGLAWTREQLAAAGSPKFRLVDFTLERAAPRTSPLTAP